MKYAIFTRTGFGVVMACSEWRDTPKGLGIRINVLNRRPRRGQRFWLGEARR